VTQIATLRHNERIVIDTRRLDGLCARLGSRVAEAHVIDRVEAITDRLAEIDFLHRQGLSPELQPAARQVARLSDEIGLVSLARVANDLSAAAGRGDPTAYRAIWDRLVRIGDRSLAQMWDVPGLSM